MLTFKYSGFDPSSNAHHCPRDLLREAHKISKLLQNTNADPSYPSKLSKSIESLWHDMAFLIDTIETNVKLTVAMLTLLGLAWRSPG